MSGYYSRKSYDKSHSRKQEEISTMQGWFKIGNFFGSNDTLAPPSIIGGKNKMGNVGLQTDIESNLKRLDVRKTGKFVDESSINNSNMRAKNMKNMLNNTKREDAKQSKLSQAFSRMDNHPVHLRSATINRFEFLIKDPRENVFYGFPNQEGDLRFGIDTRAQAKFNDQDDYHNNVIDKKL